MTVEEARKYLREIVDTFRSRPENPQQVEYFARFRELPASILNQQEAFMVEDDIPANFLPPHLQHMGLGFCIGDRLVYSGRFVFPVKDVDGNIAGFVGNDAFEHPKYLDSKNIGYKANTNLFAGSELLPKAYSSAEPVFVVEGKIDQLRLLDMDFIGLCTLGAYMSSYQVTILKRLGSRVVCIWDNDAAGKKATERTKILLPQAKVIRPTKLNDLDDVCKSGAPKEELKREILSLIQNPFKQVPDFRREK